MTSEIHSVKNAISTIFCTKTTDRCVKGKNPLGLIPYKDGFAYDDNVCWQGVEERFLFLLLSGLSGICGISCIFPPGSICGYYLHPRALPPVTQSSALQAPERMWIRMLKTSNPW